MHVKPKACFLDEKLTVSGQMSQKFEKKINKVLKHTEGELYIIILKEFWL